MVPPSDRPRAGARRVPIARPALHGHARPVYPRRMNLHPTVGGPGLAQRRHLVTEIPGPVSRELLERRQRSVARGLSHVLPIFVTAAGGGVLVDADGNSLIDSGSEAVENAVKIARHATGRQAVVVFDHAYHGRTNLTMAMTAKNMPYKDGFGPFAGEVYRAPMAYPFRWPGGQARCAAEALDVVTSLIHAQVGEHNVAAVVIEPVQGEGGFIVPPDGFLPGLAEYCAEHGIVFVADEIQSGFCRTGDWFACDHEGVVPDLVTTAKGIAGGLPLAAVTGRTEIMDSVHPGGLGGTYGGNPVACAAALGAIEAMRKEDLPAAARRIGDIMLPRLRKLAERHPIIADVRGRGAMIAIELVKAGTIEPDAAAASQVAKACHRAGVIVLTCGTYGNVLRFLPPLVISEELLTEGLSVLEEAFATL